MKRYNSTGPWAKAAPELPEVAELETSTPARPAGVVPDVLVPAFQAGITGALVGGVFALAVGQLVPSHGGNLFALLGMAALIVSALTWLLLLVDTRRLLWAIERLTGQDLDSDQKVGQPERLVFVDRGKAKVKAEQDRKYDSWASFLSFVRRLPVKGTALSAWQADIGRDNYTTYRDALIDYGFARWNSYRDNGEPNKSQGWALVHDAPYILERLSISGGA